MNPTQALMDKDAALAVRHEEIIAKAREAGAFDEESQAELDAVVKERDGLDGLIKAGEGIRSRERAATTAAIPDVPDDALASTSIKVGADLSVPFRSLGEMLQATHASAAGRDSNAESRLVMAADYAAAAQGAGEAIDSEGGFLVQTDIQTSIRQAIMTGSELLSRVTPIPISGTANGTKLAGVDEISRKNGSRWGGIQGYWVDEGTAPTESKATFWRRVLELHKVAALGYATDELLADAAQMTTIFTNGFANELRFKVEDAMFEGDGAGKPQGILTADAVITVSKETGQAPQTVVHDNLIKMWARLPVTSRANAVWFINQDVEPSLDNLAKDIGTAGVEPSYVTVTDAGVQRIKGAPVVPIEYASTLGTIGDIVLTDMSQYGFIEKGGINQASSLHVRFTTDEMAFRATWRVDGNSLWKSDLTPFQGTNTQSPIIKLATRSS